MDITMVDSQSPYESYTPSGLEWLGDVPPEWAVSRLKAHLLANDSGVWGEDFDEEGTIVLRSTEQTVDGGWRISKPARIRLPKTEKDAASLAENDLVMTKSSGSEAHIGKTSIVTASIAAMNCCFSNFMQRIRLDVRISPHFIWYLFNSSIGRNQLVYQSTTTTGLGNLNGKIIANYVLTFPPLAEQAAIVRYLDYVDRRVRRYVAAKRKLIALLEEERQAVIHQAVTRGLDPNVPLKPSGVDWLGDIPAHWKAVELGRIGKFFKGSGGSKEDETSEGVPCIRYGDIYTKYSYHIEECDSFIAHERTSDYTRLETGDILFAGSGETIEEIGKSAVNLMTNVAFCGGDLILLRLGIEASPRFMGYAMDCDQSTHQKSCMGRGTTVMHIYSFALKYMHIALPPVSEQVEISSFIDCATATIDLATSRARRQIELLEEYRTRLIADVVTGKLDVRAAAGALPDAEDDAIPPWGDGALIDSSGAAAETASGTFEEAAT